MFTLTLPLQMRLANEQDLDFFKRLYATTRDELKTLGLSAQQFDELLLSQQKIQEHGVKMTYPEAQQWLIFLKTDQPVNIGRLIVDFTDNDWRIVDIAILPEYRNQGWGKQVMLSVMAEAQLSKGSVSLGVMCFNHGAQKLYRQLGFSVIRQDAIHAQMIWRSKHTVTQKIHS